MFTRVRIPSEDEIGLQRQVDENLRLEWTQIHAE
jgi:hypothetical protein